MGLPFSTALVLSAFLAAAAWFAPPEQTSSLRLVSTAWPPFTNESGQPRVALDLVEAALGRISVGATTTIVEAARFTPALLNDEFDGSAAAWRDGARERVLIFSEPYLENRLILVGRRGDDVSAQALADLKGKRMAVVEGYSYGEALDASGATLVRSTSEEDNLTLLLTHKADYALMDELVVHYLVSTYPEESATKLSLGSTPIVTRALCFAVRRSRPDAESIIRRFNAELVGMIADRTYHRLLRVAWIRADVDGDGLTELVPQSDRTGAAEPERAYSLFSTSQQTATSKPASTQSRFYVGGTVYNDWSLVPNQYKVSEPPPKPDPRTTTPLFKHSW